MRSLFNLQSTNPLNNNPHNKLCSAFQIMWDLRVILSSYKSVSLRHSGKAWSPTRLPIPESGQWKHYCADMIVGGHYISVGKKLGRSSSSFFFLHVIIMNLLKKKTNLTDPFVIYSIVRFEGSFLLRSLLRWRIWYFDRVYLFTHICNIQIFWCYWHVSQ